MATEWARLAFNEEFISPAGERIDPPSSESSEATLVEILASSLLTPSSENAQPEVERDWTRPHKRLSLPRSLSSNRPYRLNRSLTFFMSIWATLDGLRINCGRK